MPEVNKSVLVGYAPEQMFSLVDAVESYPEFLPWCGGARVSYRDEQKTRATIQIHYRGVKQSFTTENVKQPGRSIWIKLVEGPFKTLDGTWNFMPLADHGCKVELRLHYEFSSRILEKLVGPVFSYIANTLIEAFVRRAENVYAHDKTRLAVEVVYALPGEQILLSLGVTPGTTVFEAIEQSGIRRRFPDIDPVRGKFGIFGRLVKPDTVLKDGDRVEIYRPLVAGAGTARRQRARQKR